MAEPIIRFKADREVIQAGESATLRWHVENVRAVHFFAEGERWREHGVVGEGEQQVSPSETTTYCLRVTKDDDSVEVRKRTIQVQRLAKVEVGGVFSADRAEIQPGECATFRWHVEGVKAVYFYAEGDRWREHGVVGEGEQQMCPLETTTYCLRVIKGDDSVDMHTITIQVRAQAGSQTFSADRTEIQRGECVTFRWRVSEVKAVYFHAEGERWQDHGVVGEGQQQVCLSQTTTYCLRVVKQDNTTEIHYITVQVRG
jgi:hypothetical protein